MSRTDPTWPNPTRTSPDAKKGAYGNRAAAWRDDDDDSEDGADATEDARAERERRAEQKDAAATAGGQGDEPRTDAAALDDQLMRAEGEGMVTEHAKVSATDPGPEPLPEPDADPEPDHGPGEDFEEDEHE